MYACSCLFLALMSAFFLYKLKKSGSFSLLLFCSRECVAYYAIILINQEIANIPKYYIRK